MGIRSIGPGGLRLSGPLFVLATQKPLGRQVGCDRGAYVEQIADGRIGHADSNTVFKKAAAGGLSEGVGAPPPLTLLLYLAQLLTWRVGRC